MEQLIPTEAQKVITQSVALVKKFENFAVVSAETRSIAAENLKTIKAKTKELEELRFGMTRPLDESKRRIMDLFKAPLVILNKAELAIKTAIVNWQQEQERIRFEQERKIQEAARKEEERLRKIKEEQERMWREKQEAIRKQMEQATAEGRKKEAERLKLEAEKAQAKADERAQQAEEVEVIPEVVESKVEKISGISTKKIWKFRIVDVNKIPREFMIPNEKLLGGTATQYKGNAKVEGVEFYFEEIIASGR